MSAFRQSAAATVRSPAAAKSPVPMSEINRRKFLQATTAVLSARLALSAGAQTSPAPKAPSPPFEEWLRVRHQRVCAREDVEAFLQPLPNNQWAKFDPELGYIPSDSMQRDGIDGSLSVYRYGPAGERKVIHYADRPCRLNTYGNSFTHCHQVSDGETWQEDLAAHLGEPIRNFGVGGYGVYQAFARLRRTEQTAVKTPYIILNIYDDDHVRTLMPWRAFMTGSRYQSNEMFHGTPWSHLRVDLDSGRWVETPGACPTPAALREMVGFERARELVAGHEIVQLRAMMDGVPDVPTERIRRLADWAKFRFDFTEVASRRDAATQLMDSVARASTLHVMEQLHAFAGQQGRRLMVLLSYGTRAIRRACEGGAKLPADLALLQWLKDRGIPSFDAFDAHVADFAQFRLTPADYIKRLYNGHYTPAGNQFFAFAIKNQLVQWLDPKPATYRASGKIIDFQDGRYLDKPPEAGVKKT